MTGYLLDTSVISIIAPGKPPLPVPLASWLREHDGELFVPAIAVAEIEEGICKLRRAGGTRRANLLSAWLDALIQNYAERVLPLDAACGRVAGALSDTATAAGRNPGFPDVAIAAIASVHELIVLTRNHRHFANLGVEHIDPFELG